MMAGVLDRRRAGVLLHPTSLPSDIGNGDLGAESRRFIQFLSQTGFSVWQMLPIGPTHRNASPYNTLSLHAGNPLLISLDQLVEWGWLDRDSSFDKKNPVAYRLARLAQAHKTFRERASATDQQAFEDFAQQEKHWLEDYALYRVLRRHHDGQAWFQWPTPLRTREPSALASTHEQYQTECEQIRFEQFVFKRQWDALRAYAMEHKIALFGDMPIFVAHDSVDVWAEPNYFQLDEHGMPLKVAGVPPDYFSRDGQRWGNPLYRWDRMQADGFRWWIARLTTEFRRFDLLRIDHFRGFEACWEIPVNDTTAINGKWAKSPGQALFETLRKHFGELPLVAEDLGLITPEVLELRDRFQFPGMEILQFAFDGGSDNPYLPHNHRFSSVVYTGTHDNDTTLSWFEGLPAEQQLRVVEYLGYPHEPMPWPIIRATLASVSQLAILPMQDVLALGSGQRMNTPGTSEGNWHWRFSWDQLPPEQTALFARALKAYGRN